MKIKNDNYREVINQGFLTANFVNDVGIALLDCGPGWCETQLAVSERHLQQNSVVHAGVQSTMADHTAGAAAATIIAADEFVLTLEYKINLLRAAPASRLRCRADVIKPGKNFSVVESAVYVDDGPGTVLISKGIFTIAVLKNDSKNSGNA
jgi:uncharacterized protein (TIGR00369 family)